MSGTSGNGSAMPGWYPDPAGQPGRFRFWDGRAWSSTTSPHPGGDPFRTAEPAGFDPSRRRGSAWVWAVGGAAVVLAIIVALVWVVRPENPDRPPAVSSSPPVSPVPPIDICTEPSPAPGQDVPVRNGRVQSGRLSAPHMAPPFGAPSSYTLLRFSYLSDVASQFAVLRYRGRSTGGAEVMIARLPLLDGFPAPRQTAGLLFDCVRSRFPNSVERGRTGAMRTVDGRPAWSIRTHLGYGGPVEAGVRSATIIVLVVATTDAENGLWYAYLPDTHPELVPRAERALAQLQVR